MRTFRPRGGVEGDRRCVDRRAFVSSVALLAGAAMLDAALPAPAEAKAAKRAKAVRKKRYAIVYKLNGGTQRTGQVKTVAQGRTLSTSKLKKPKRRGYTFGGWYANARLTKRATSVQGKARKAARTVFAKWKPKRYRISYKMNGGKAAQKLPASYTVESKRIVPRAPERRGHDFLGWYADSKFKKAKPAIEHGSVGDVKLYARWQRVKYAITYDLGGGKATVALPKSYTVASSEIRPIVPVKAGQRFVGWYTGAKLSQKVDSIPSGSVGNVDLHAKWTPTDYWEAHLATKCARVNKLAARMENPVPSFVFITDMHLPTSVLVSPELVRRVVAATDTNMVVFGGDAINKSTSKSQATGMLRYVRRAFGNVETHLVRGNHDGNRQGSWTSGTRITDAEFAEIALHESEVHPAGCIYCYRDDAKCKVRYIFLDSGEPNYACMNAKQTAWLKKRVLELSAGWTVLVFVHQFYTKITGTGEASRVTYDANGTAIKKTLDSIFDQAKASIAGVISGHCHKDYVEYSVKGYPMISTTCDAFGRGKSFSTYAYKLGTLKEHAFDVVSLDTGRRKLYFTRVGTGKNRTFDYPAPAVQPIAPAEPDTPVEPTVPEAPAEPEAPSDQNPADSQPEGSAAPLQAAG